MGKLNLCIGAFMDLVVLNLPGVANLIFIYSICNQNLVMC